MPTDYVEDYEEISGLDREDTAAEITTKVVTAPAKADPKTTTAQTKAAKAK